MDTEIHNKPINAEAASEKFEFTSQLITELLNLQDLESIYKYITASLVKHLPDTVILYNSVDEKNKIVKLETIAGIDHSFLSRILKVAGINPIGKKYKLVTTHDAYFRSGKLVEFKGTLAEFSSSDFSPMVARTIEKLIGLHQIYTIGIIKDEVLLAAIHFFTFNKKVITDSSFIETLVKLAGIVIQKKIAEQALKESEEHYRQLVEQSPDGITIFQIEPDSRPGKFVEANDTATQMLGYTLKEMLKLSPQALEPDASEIQLGYRETELKRQGLVNFETKLRHKNGHLIYVAITAKLIEYKGKPAVMNIVRDLTSHIQARDALKDMHSGLSVLNDASAGFTDVQAGPEFYAEVARNLKFMTGGMSATLGIYYPTDRCIHVKHTEADAGAVNSIIQALGGKRLNEVGFPISDEVHRKLEKQPICYYESIHEATFGVVPMSIGLILQQVQGIDRFLGIAYYVDNELFGTSLVAFHSGTPDPSPDLIQSFANVVALALRRIRVEEQLRLSEEKFRSIFENSTIGIYRTSPEGQILLANPSLVSMLGFDSFEDMRHRNLENEFYEPEYPRFDFKHQIELHGEVKGIESAWKRKDNTVLYVRESAKVFRDGEGQPLYYEGTVEDITRSKLAETELISAKEKAEENEQKLLAFINSIPDLICYKDGKGRWMLANNADLTLFGLLGVNYYGKTDAELAEYTHEIYREAFMLCMVSDEEAWENGNLTRGVEIIPTAAGEKKYFDVYKIPIFNKNGQRKALAVVGRDITELINTQNQLASAKEKAEESDRLKSAFLENMSHEIRTPLNSIIGFSELITHLDFGSAEHAEFAQLINDSGNNLLSVLSDIMDLSKIEAGQIQIRNLMFSVNHLIGSVRNDFLPKAAKKGIELRLNQPDFQEEIMIHSDRERIRQVLNNLIGNAIKFTDKGFIEIGIQHSGEFVQFHVKDTGIGIPEAYHEKVFERFRQVETAHTRKYGGNGLGLAISKHLVEILGGTIRMESENGKGSTFYFTVPVG